MSFLLSFKFLPVVFGRRITAAALSLCFGSSVDLLLDELRPTKLKGALSTSASWFEVDLTEDLSQLEVPALVLNPGKDWWLGCTPTRHLLEVSKMPPDTGEYQFYPNEGHLMALEKLGSQVFVDAVVDFIQRKGLIS